MNLKYYLKINDPEQHLAEITIKGERTTQQMELTFFLPSWSPGSYLMREYARNIRWFTAQTDQGDYLNFEQTHKGKWRVDWNTEEHKDKLTFEIKYAIYCHELTVRTSHIDASHAFIHGPSVFMGIENVEILNPQLQISWDADWSKISTGLKDISAKREEFLYTSDNFDTFIDAPIEIGNQETDGFLVEGKNHYLCFYGKTLPHKQDIKKDMKTIVEYVASTMGDIPYEDYTFITHFIPGQYGGLEHLNSTALIFDGTRLNERKRYLKWVELVAHEYFHTWNVKRIRPKELGPFQYCDENYTSMLWLAEGLTSFMDQLFVYRSGVGTLKEYIEEQKENLNAYLSIPGRKFHSLEQSSFNAWVKLYRPDENSANSSISYYLKGGIVFFALHLKLKEKGVDTNELLKLLWEHYKSNPLVGIEKHEVYQMIEKLGGVDILEFFKLLIEDVEDPDFESLLKSCGVAIEWESSEKPWLGLNPSFDGERVLVKDIILDGPAYKDGINAGDELLAIDSIRVTKSNYNDILNNLLKDRYEVLLSRNNYLTRVTVVPEFSPRKIKELKLVDEKLAQSVFMV